MATSFTPETCPVSKDTKEFTGLSSEMLRILRKLKRDLKNCPSCDYFEDCPTLKAFNSSVAAAIATVNEEWNLTVPIE